MNPRYFYRATAVFFLAGCGWLIFQQLSPSAAQPVVLCPVKLLSGVPCPSCGTTRAMTTIMEGEFAAGLGINPLGGLMAGLMLIFPFWWGHDRLRQKQSLLRAYTRTEQVVRIPWVAILLVVLIAGNWYWNIVKEL